MRIDIAGLSDGRVEVTFFNSDFPYYGVGRLFRALCEKLGVEPRESALSTEAGPAQVGETMSARVALKKLPYEESGRMVGDPVMLVLSFESACPSLADLREVNAVCERVLPRFAYELFQRNWPA